MTKVSYELYQLYKNIRHTILFLHQKFRGAKSEQSCLNTCNNEDLNENHIASHIIDKIWCFIA